MKEITIKQIANGFIVEIRDPAIERQQKMMNYTGHTSNQLCFKTIEEVTEYVSKSFITDFRPVEKE